MFALCHTGHSYNPSLTSFSVQTFIQNSLKLLFALVFSSSASRCFQGPKRVFHILWDRSVSGYLHVCQLHNVYMCHSAVRNHLSCRTVTNHIHLFISPPLPLSALQCRPFKPVTPPPALSSPSPPLPIHPPGTAISAVPSHSPLIPPFFFSATVHFSFFSEM